MSAKGGFSPEVVVALILGISKTTKERGELCSSDAADPALDRFLRSAWEAAIVSDAALASRAPGLYPLTVRFDYDVAGFEVVGLRYALVEGARDPAVDDSFVRALHATGRVSQKHRAAVLSRTIVSTVLVEIPADLGVVPNAAPEVTASFTDVVRAVIGGGGRLLPGDHVVDLHVAPIGDRWSVAPAGAAPAGGIVHTLLAALRQAGLLAEGSEADASGQGRVSLLVRAPAVR